MLYVLKVTDEFGDFYEYEYGNFRHAMEHYIKEDTATVIEYYHGKEKILVSKICGKECEV